MRIRVFARLRKQTSIKTKTRVGAQQLGYITSFKTEVICYNAVRGYGAVAQLIRVLPWHGRSRGFESLQLHQEKILNFKRRDDEQSAKNKFKITNLFNDSTDLVHNIGAYLEHGF